MGPKAIQFIQAVARKLLSKRGEGIASIANRMEAESKAGEIAETFRLSGLTPNKWDEFIQSENDVVKYLNIIESSKKPQILRDGNTLGGSKFNRVGEVFDMTGKKLDSSRGIMGGTQIDEKSLKEALMKTDNPFSDLVKTTKKGPKTLAEREAEVLARMNRENKEAVERLKNKKDLDEPEGFYQGGQAQIEPDLSDVGHGSDALMARNRLLTPGSQATTSTGLNYLLGEDNDTTRVPYKNAGPVILPKPKPKPKADPMVELQRIYDLYQEVAPGVAQETQKYLQQDFINKLNEANISQEQFMTNQMQNNFAEGGPARQNFAMGKRAFLKMLGGVGAGIAGIKTGLLGLGKKEVAKKVVKEVATSSGGGVPPYFLNLVSKIKNLGDDAPRLATKDREKITTYKDYTLTEDVTTGEQTIQRMKVTDPDSASYYGQPLTEETYMSYKPGKGLADETTKGKTIPDEYEEGTAHIRSDGPNSGEIVDESFEISDEVIEEGTKFEDNLSDFGKADGGRIGYSKGDIVTKGIPALLDLVKNKFGKKAITTADKLKTPQKTLDREMFNKFKDRNPDPKRQITDDEFQDLMEDVGDLDAYNFDGTIGSANKIRKEAKDYQDYMYKQYKMGKLDPVAGDKSPGRKRFLEQKLDDMEGSGDKRLMSPDEIEELSSFDLGTQMDQMKKKTLPEIDDKLLKNYNDEIKRGVAEIMGDTSPEALKKSIEIDNLMLKYPGMDKNLADQIASSSPRMKADMIAMVEQTFKMSEKGMSGDDIIQTFKNTTRRKQATGGLASMLGE